MLTTSDIIEKYIAFFEKREHVRIANAPLVPQNDPTTLFTSSGMQPLVPYLLGEPHPQGKRLVNVQNSFRAQDIDEIGDNRHTTFFRMLGNWSLGDYFKKEQIPWVFEFLTKELKLPADKLYVTIFEGYKSILKDTESLELWKDLFTNAEIATNGRIFQYATQKNWWSRSGGPDEMPVGEPGGPDSEVFYDFGHELKIHEQSSYRKEVCHVNCDCGRYLEICNSVFMQYRKEADGTLSPLPEKNVDFGGGVERLLQAVHNQPDVFKTNLFSPIIQQIEKTSSKVYEVNSREMRIIADHLVSASFIILSGIKPSNKEQGYILRRLIRRAHDNLSLLGKVDVSLIIETICAQYKPTDPAISELYELIKNTILEEIQRYDTALSGAKRFIHKKYKIGDELMGSYEISADDAFILYTTHGLSPTQIKSLGFVFNDQEFAQKMEEHQKISRKGIEKKFHGGLADQQELTVKGHTATHLLHQALRDMLGTHVHQTGSNITSARLRFDFNYDQKLTDEQIQKLEEVVREKTRQNLPVHFEMLPTHQAKKMGAIGLFDTAYADTSKIYFIGGSSKDPQQSYSIEFCGGPHVSSTGEIKSFKIIKQENIGNKQRRLYAVVQ